MGNFEQKAAIAILMEALRYTPALNTVDGSDSTR